VAYRKPAKGSSRLSNKDNGTGTIVGWSFDHPWQNQKRARIDCLKKGGKIQSLWILESRLDGFERSRSLIQLAKLGSGLVIDCRLNISSRPFEM
jgi:hypothetical protein